MHLRKIFFLSLVLICLIQFAQAGEQMTLSPDGGHSNQKQISEALKNGDVYLSAGVYEVDDTIILPPNRALRGDPNAIVRVWSGSSQWFTGLKGVISCGDVVAHDNIISGFQMDGNIGNLPKSYADSRAETSHDCEKLIILHGYSNQFASNITISHMKLYNSFSDGAYILFGDHIDCSDNLISNCQHEGLYFSCLKNGMMYRNKIAGITSDAARLDNCVNCKVFDNIFFSYNGESYGAFKGGQAGLQVANAGSSHGYNAANKPQMTDRVEITNNTFADPGRTAIWLHNYGGSVYVHDNYFKDAAGIETQGIPIGDISKNISVNNPPTLEMSEEIFSSIFDVLNTTFTSSGKTNQIADDFNYTVVNTEQGKIAGGKFTGTGFYGLHLILLYPYLYILLLFSVLLVWDFASLLIMLVSILPRIPIALLIAIPVVVISSIWAIIKGFIGSKKTKDLSIPITSKEQPDIWSICDGVAREVGTRPLDKIMLSPNSGIGVHLEGGLFRLFIGRTKRVLTIGLPSISNITYSEMKAILAHEFGHFSNKDTAWSSFTYTMAASLQNTLAVMPSPQKTEGSNYLTVVSALNPALWVLLGYKFMFQVFTSGFSRMREVFADKTAISLYGYKNFTDGLMKIARNDYVFSQYFTNKLIEMMRESGQVYTNIYQFMEETNQSLGKDGKKILDNVESEILNEEKASKFDSHPLLRERLGYAKQFEVESKYKTEKKLFSQAFKRWDTVSKEMSDLYTYFIGTLIGYKFNQAEQTNNTNQ